MRSRREREQKREDSSPGGFWGIPRHSQSTLPRLLWSAVAEATALTTRTPGSVCSRPNLGGEGGRSTEPNLDLEMGSGRAGCDQSRATWWDILQVSPPGRHSLTMTPIHSQCPTQTLRASCAKEASSLPTQLAGVCCPPCLGSPYPHPQSLTMLPAPALSPATVSDRKHA